MITDSNEKIIEDCSSIPFQVEDPDHSVKYGTSDYTKKSIPHCLVLPSYDSWIHHVPYNIFSSFQNRQLESIIKLLQDRPKGGLTYYVGIAFNDAVLNIVLHTNHHDEMRQLRDPDRFQNKSVIMVDFVISDRYFRDIMNRTPYIKKQLMTFGLPMDGIYFPIKDSAKKIVKELHNFMINNADKFIFQEYRSFY